jgi:thymidylate synthase
MTGSNIEVQYLNLLKYIIGVGIQKKIPTGNCLSIYGRQIRHSMPIGVPVVTTSKLDWDSIKTEVVGLNNSPEILELVARIKQNPDSMDLIYSNNGYEFGIYTRELSIKERMDLASKSGWTPTYNIDDYEHSIFDTFDPRRRSISLLWRAPSIDAINEFPYKFAVYSILLKLISVEVQMLAEEVIANLEECHIHVVNIDGAKEQNTRAPYPLPTITITKKQDMKYTEDDLHLVSYHFHPGIRYVKL